MSAARAGEARADSVGRVLLVAFSVALFCSLIVSAAVYWLKPLQAAFQLSAQNQAVLVAAGIFEPDAEPTEEDSRAQGISIETRVADLESGGWADVGADYDFRAAIDDPAARVAIATDLDAARLGERPRLMPVYLVRTGAGAVRVVVPVYGRGMWSTVHGFIGLDSDLRTVAGVTFYEHGETAGIGDRIQAPAWLASWRGKRVYAPDGSVAFGIGAEAADPASRVDSISGATVTVVAVDRFVRYWLGADGYGPVLALLREEAL